MGITRRSFTTGATVLAGATLVPWQSVAQQNGTLRVAISGPVVPRTTGVTNGGVEGMRFIGFTLYDPLVYWGLPGPDNANPLLPMLASEWAVDEADPRRWIFSLRRGVTFHDGSALDADAIVWNFRKLYDEDSPQYKADEGGFVQSILPMLSSWEKLDDHTVMLQTDAPDSFFPYTVGRVTFASPAQWERLGGDWTRFASEPSGTGPFRLAYLDPQERAELVRNEDYWDAQRIPRVERMIIHPVPEANTRSASLMSGQVDWIEAVAPDTIPALEASGMQVVTNPYPQIWSYWPSRVEGSPWNDLRVRRAANLAIDREGLTAVLNGMMIPARGLFLPEHPWFGNPSFEIRYDPEAARQLLAEAGYSPDDPLRAEVLTTPGGSGVMQPEPMNAFIQRNLAEVGIEVSFISMDWNSLYTNTRRGADDESSRGATLTNISWTTHSPHNSIARLYHSSFAPPHGSNWGYIDDPEIDGLLERARGAFEPAERDRLLAAFHEKLVDDAVNIFVAHDPFPRAFGPGVTGFREGYNGIRVQDPTHISVG